VLTFVTAGTCTINADQAGDGTYLAAPTVTRSFTVNPVIPGAPTIGTATAGNTTATVTFTAPATTGGSVVTGYTVTSSPGGITGIGGTSPITVTGLTNGVAYTFTVTATNGAGTSPASAASNSVTPGTTQTPATAFATAADVIRETLTGDATRALQSNVAASQRMSRDARARFVLAQDPEAVGEIFVPVNVDGGLEVNGVTVSSKGTFYGLAGISNGTRRIVFGDFDIQHDGETGSSTATLNGRVAWEQMLSDTTMLGYFIGGELARSNIAGEFDGAQNRVGLTVGGYAVQELADHVLLDGFFSLGAGRNNLEMTDTVLALESDYTTRSASVGAALSGVVQQDGFEVRPELSLNYGRTWIGNVDFTGSAYGLVDNTLSLDAGQVSLATMMLRPEVRVPLDGLSGANSLQVVTFAPRLMCEQIKAATTEENCGGGAEVGFSGRSANGLSSVSAKVMADRIGGVTKSSLQLSLEHRF
jgi:hypothetical protein